MIPPFQNFSEDAKRVIRRSHELAIERGQQNVNSLHLLASILLEEDGFASLLFKKLGIDFSFFLQQVLEEIDGDDDHPLENTIENPQQMFLTQDLAFSIEKAVQISKVLKDSAISPEHLFLAILEFENPASILLREHGLSKEKIQEIIQEVQKEEEKLKNSFEKKYRTLMKYSQDLTKLAGENKLDPVVGREDEIERIIQILSRRMKNNPILIGDPGVGKTAIVEGLAQRIARGDVPENLKGTKLLLLDLGSLLAGTKYRGEFEERLKRILREIERNDEDIVLFIDEIHTLIGAGSSEGSMDAANMLKPALARGTIRIIGSTTRDEFQKYFERDAALVRRFQPVVVDEPTREETKEILRGLRPRYELYHGVYISDDAIDTAVELSSRYLHERKLPDKAIDLMDEASSLVKIEFQNIPEELKHAREDIQKLEIEKKSLIDFKRKTKKRDESIRKIDAQIRKIQKSIQPLLKKWEREKELVAKIQEISEVIDQSEREMEELQRRNELGKLAEIYYGKIPALKKERVKIERELDEVRSNEQITKHEVSSEDVAKVVSRWTGIPLTKILGGEKEKLLSIEKVLQRRVKGQDEAIEKVADAIRRSRTGVHDPKRPIGSFIFLGPTGVGKTELAKALAEFLFNDEKAIVRVDMSEFMERHAVSKLIGAPPGYVGYENAGLLTEAVRHRPYSIILFDEIEKAHPDVFNLLLQILDDGMLTDSKGREVNFKNTIIILTSNLGSEYLQKPQSIGFSTKEREKESKLVEEKVMEALQDFFRPEFLNRIDEIVLFRALGEKELLLIAKKELDLLKERLEKRGIHLRFTNDVAKKLVKDGFDQKYGARSLKRVIQKNLANLIAKEILSQELKEGEILHISVENDAFVMEKGDAMRRKERSVGLGKKMSSQKELALSS